MKTQIEILDHDGIGESYTRIRHKSGMTVCVLQKPVAVTYATLGVLCGALDRHFRVGAAEYTVPDGCAHFLEHKLFAAGADEDDAITRFASLGASGDAYTTPDLTAYLFSTSENEYAALEVLLDFVFHPYFTDENVAAERAIIAQEIRMYDDTPTQRGYYNTLESLYHTHPIKINVGGTEASIAEITPDVLYTFYNAFYHPSNTVLTVAGNVTPDAVLTLCDALVPCDVPPFATIRLFDAEPDTVRRTHMTDTADISSPLMYIGIKDCTRFSDRDAREKHACAVDIVNDILFCKSSAIYADLYDRGLINGKFWYEYEQAETYGYIMITAETDDPETTANAILDYIGTCVRTHAISDEQFEICRRVMYAGAVTAFESAEDMATQCLDDTIDGGELFASIDIMMSVTKDDLFRVMDTVYDPGHITVHVLLPKEQERKVTSL